MRSGKASRSIVAAHAVALLLVIGGCGQQDDKQSTADHKARAEEPQGTKPAEKKGHDHSEWWCAEHGIPEHLCSMCNEKVAAECKKKGDWCKEHDRAQSQCFKCNPKLKEQFAAMYRARYGKEPPPIEEKHK
jgi:cobalt-zinc-cadmium efflux system membrane fusion protein